VAIRKRVQLGDGGPTRRKTQGICANDHNCNIFRLNGSGIALSIERQPVSKDHCSIDNLRFDLFLMANANDQKYD